jgi:hypothetical protein
LNSPLRQKFTKPSFPDRKCKRCLFSLETKNFNFVGFLIGLKQRFNLGRFVSMDGPRHPETVHGLLHQRSCHFQRDRDRSQL